MFAYNKRDKRYKINIQKINVSLFLYITNN